MKTLFRLCWLGLCAGLFVPVVQADEAPWQLTVQTDRRGAKINPSFYGLMTEEINHGLRRRPLRGTHPEPRLKGQ